MSEKSKSKSSTGDDPNDDSTRKGDEVKVHEAISSLRELVLGEFKATIL